MDYYICNNDEPKGPYTETQLRAMWRNGSILATTLYWMDGMPEWRPVAELCDTPPQSATAKKIVGDAVQAVRSVYTSAERNISEFNDELDKAKSKLQPPGADTPQHLNPVRKLARGVHAFFVGMDKTVTRISLLRNPPFAKQLIYAGAAFVFFSILGVITFSLNRHPHKEIFTLRAVGGPYPIIGDSIADTLKRLESSAKPSKPNNNELSTISVVCSNFQSGFTVYFSDDTVVGFTFLPLKDYMDDRERRKVCSQSHADEVKASVISAYNATKSISTRDGKYYDRFNRVLDFVPFPDGSMYAYAVEYESRVGILSYDRVEGVK